MLLDEIAQGLMLGGGPILLTGGVRIPAVFYLDQYVLRTELLPSSLVP
jgi:hypothetical protein